MERVAQAGGDLWFQLYMLPDLGASYRLMDRARNAGYRALMVTLDTPVSPNREYNVRNHFTLPMQISSRNALDVMRRPAWIWNVFFRYLLRNGVPMLENYPDEYRQRLDASGKGRMSLPKTDSITWESLRALRRHWRGPLIAKGILHPEDARMARDCGVDAIVVSNHGGRNFDAAATPIERCRASSTRSQTRPRSSSTAVFAAASMWPRRLRWARAACCWAARRYGAWPAPANPAHCMRWN